MRTSSLHKTNGQLMPAFDRNLTGKESILKILAYFDIFRYPLTQGEIIKFMNQPADNRSVEHYLSELLNERSVFLHQEYYSLQDNPLITHRRNEGQQRAEQLLKKAMKVGRFLYQFPFVKGVAVSGSLSKNFADEKADVDFFIITKANRLWLARTFMHFYKKFTFLTSCQHYYCMNYYIDEEALLLEDKNIYTAIELKTLLPVCGQAAMQDFFSTNNWADEWLPSCEFRSQSQKDPRISFLKRSAEWILNNKAGNTLNKWLFKITARRWKNKKEKGKKNNKGMTMELITDRHFAKSDPGNFQAKVLQQYEQRVAELTGMHYLPPIVSSVK